MAEPFLTIFVELQNGQAVGWWLGDILYTYVPSALSEKLIISNSSRCISFIHAPSDEGIISKSTVKFREKYFYLSKPSTKKFRVPNKLKEDNK